VSNHLEDLVAEWLEYRGYFVRKSVLVGKRLAGGFEGELDVVGLNPITRHLIHVECSLDADPWPKREHRFTLKFERGRKYIPSIFHDIATDQTLDQVALMQFGGGSRTTLGGARLVWVCDFLTDMICDLASKKPEKEAVPSTLPLIRTLQLAAQPARSRKCQHRLLPLT
jgi:hypothetical protein